MNTLATASAQPPMLIQPSLEIPVGGTIRSGIMVLTREAAGNPKAVEMYEEGVESGEPFKSLNDRIKSALRLSKNPLTPRNAPYFTVRASDFAIPEVADRIMDLYAEDRGDGDRLYRFPIVFPVDQIAACIPHEFACYTASERRFWSVTTPAGDRFCMTKAPVEMSRGNQRAKKIWGGRPTMLRPDNGGVCDPNACPEYQSGACGLSGRIVGYIPGVPGTKAIQVKTRSFYSLQSAVQQLSMVAFLRGGKISGMHNGKAIFWVAKREEEVSMIDPGGKARRVKQWLITIDTDITMTSLYSGDVLEHAEEAAKLLTGETVPEQSEEIIAEQETERATETAPEPVKEQTTAPEKKAIPEGVASARSALVETAKKLGIEIMTADRDFFRSWAVTTSGDPHWWTSQKSLTALRMMIEDDPVKFQEDRSMDEDAPPF